MKTKSFINYVPKDGIPPTSKETKEAKDKFVNDIKATLNDQYKTCEEVFSRLKIKVGKTKQSASFNGETCEVDFLPSASIKQRKLFQQKAVEKFANAHFELERQNANLSMGNIVNKRICSEFFGKHFDADASELQGPAVFNILKSPGIAIEEKRDLFMRYIRNGARVVDGMYKEYSSDKEKVEKLGEMHQASCVFGVDRVDVLFEEITNSPLDPEGSTKNMDEYKTMRKHFQDLNNYVENEMDKIMDPSYCYFDEENIKKMGSFLEESSFYLKVGSKLEHGINAQIGDGLTYNTPIEDSYTALTNAEQYAAGYDSFEYLKLKNNLEDDTKYFDKNGIIDEKTAQKKMRNHEAIGYINNEGSSLMVKCGKYGSINEVDVTGAEIDHKGDYKKMLDTLNSGTSAFTRSSKEYKNMRSILGKLSQGKGNEKELLDELKTNIDRYNENYKSKEKSPTALKRKGLVDEVSAKLEGIQDEKEIYASIKEHANDMEKESQKGRKQLIIESEKGNNNSVRLTNEDKKEISKNMENTKEAEEVNM